MKNVSYKIVRTFNLLFAILPSLAFYRATVQPDYNWGLLAISGTGRSQEYTILVVFLLWAWASFLLERWYKRKWYYLFPIVLFGVSAAAATYGYLSDQTMTFQGDAWWINWNLGIIYVILTFIPLIFTIIWTVKDTQDFQPATIICNRSLRWQLPLALLLSAIILFLFGQGRGGEHTNLDRLAVGLTVIQGLIIAYLNDRKPQEIS